VLCICSENPVNNRLVFWLLLSSACTSIKTVSPNSPLWASRLGVGKRLVAKIADLN